MQNDFQLNLVENYLIKLKYTQDMKRRNINDFGFLLQTYALDNRKEHVDSSQNNSRESDSSNTS